MEVGKQEGDDCQDYYYINRIEREGDADAYEREEDEDRVGKYLLLANSLRVSFSQ